MGSTHTPDTLRMIPSELLNRLAKLTSLKPYFHSERVDNVYPDYTNNLHKTGLAPPIVPTMGELQKGQDKIMDIENEK